MNIDLHRELEVECRRQASFEIINHGYVTELASSLGNCADAIDTWIRQHILDALVKTYEQHDKQKG